MVMEMNSNFLSNLVIKKIYSAATVFTEKNTKNTRSNRSCWAVIMKYEGETKYFLKDKTVLSDKNNVVVLPKGSSYEWLCTQSGHFYSIEFDSDLTSNEIFSFKIKNPDNLIKRFNEIEYKRMAKTPLFEMESLEAVYSVMIYLINSNTQSYFPPKKQTLIEPAISYILENYTKKIKNDDLSKLCGISTVYFRKIFKHAYGTTPIAYIREIKIKKAKEMLRSDYGSIDEISKSLGYNNIYDFSRDFKKHTGIAPSKYPKHIQ